MHLSSDHASSDHAKAAARALRIRLSDAGIDISHSLALECVARQLGHADWNTAAAAHRHGPAGTGPSVPLLRIFDQRVAEEFYLDHLGFSVLWEHRFAADMPVYLRITRDDTLLDLTEHHGDGTPGSVVWVPVADVRALHTELRGRPHPRLRPGVDDEAPGGPTLELTDPFGNILRFCEPRP